MEAAAAGGEKAGAAGKGDRVTEKGSLARLRAERKLRNWVRRQSEREAEAAAVLYRAPCGDPYLDRLRVAFERPDLLREIPVAARVPFVWNAGSDIEFAISRSFDASEALLGVLATVPAAFEGAFGGEPEHSGGAYMFWDNVTCFAFDRPKVQQAIFDALVVQLGSGDKWCQQSALHGFNHLEDVRCRPIIEAFQRACGDPELVAYAEASKNFATP